MMTMLRQICSLLVAAPLGVASVAAQALPPGGTAQPGAPNAVQTPAVQGPAPLVVLFASGSSALRLEDKAVLDRASRAYNEGKPIVMILTGTSDKVGNSEGNLILSQRRATAVLKGLLDRGIPADRFQVLAKGETELPVPTGSGVPEAKNRSVAISWR